MRDTGLLGTDFCQVGDLSFIKDDDEDADGGGSRWIRPGLAGKERAPRKDKDKIKEEHTGETIYGLENFLLMPEIFIRHSGYVWRFVSLKSFRFLR